MLIDTPSAQVTVEIHERGRITTMASAYDVRPDNRGRDVVVNASYCGVLPARFIGEHMPRGSIGVDCAVGPTGAAIAGLWYLEALGIPAAAADIATVRLGDGGQLFREGVVSYLNQPAADCGVVAGMPVHAAAKLMLIKDPARPSPEQVTNRLVVANGPDGRQVVCSDSIAFGLPADRDTNVLVTAGHTGTSATLYVRKFSPLGFISSDGGRGVDDGGMAALYMVESDGIAGATVDARLARMGDGQSTYYDGVISACNSAAASCGVRVAMTCIEAADLMVRRSLDRPHRVEQP